MSFAAANPWRLALLATMAFGAGGALLRGQSDSGAGDPQGADLPELLGYWQLAINGTNRAADGSHGLPIGGAWFDGRSVVLDGRTACIVFPGCPTVTGSFSTAVWINPSATDRLMRILGRYQVAGGNRDFGVFLHVENRLWVFLSEGGGLDRAILKATALPVGGAQEWRHVAATWDASRGSTGLVVYVDGRAVALADAQASEIHSVHSGQATLSLGAYDLPTDLDDAPLVNPFEGAISQLVLFKGVLSPLELADLYDQGRTGDLMPYLSVYRRESSQASAAPGQSGAGEARASQRTVAASRAPRGTLYVDGQIGDDGFDGAHPSVVDRAQQRGPKRTINRALQDSENGGTVYVAGGEYREEVRNSKVRMIATGRVVLK